MRTAGQLSLVAALLLCAISAAHARRQASAPAKTAAASPSPAARALDAQERRGRVIYLRGESPSGGEITATVGEVDVPASTVSCAGCHGQRGEGKTEGGVTAGKVTWADLVKPVGHTHASGRRHGPFDAASFARSLAGGVDPAGNQLLVAMPRYKMSAEDLADLVAYLKRIEEDRDPGLTETAVRVGTILPSAGPLAETGAAMRDVLAAYFEDVNAKGGIYNRRVELRVVASGGDAAGTASSAKALMQTEGLFAFVGGVSAGADKELASLAREEEIPFVGSSTLMPRGGRYVFYLLPGVEEQARSLVNFAASRAGASKPRAAVVAQSGEMTGAAADAAADSARRSGFAQVARESYGRGTLDATALARKLKADGVEVVFFFGAGGEETSLLREAEAAGWTPSVFLLGAMTGRELTGSVSTAFKDKIFLAFPTVPSDVTPDGVAEFRALQAKYKFAQRNTASQLAAFAAAKTFVEGLKRAGQDLSRERLVATLEGLYDFETGVTPRLSFGPDKRVGASGAYVVTVNPETKEYVVAGGWVKSY